MRDDDRVLTLDVLDGKHRRSVTVDGARVQIGRDLECDVQLPGDPTVSRIHAVLTCTSTDQWQIEDAGSRNGTYLNGRRLVAPRPVSSADRILIGNFVLVMQTGDAVTETIGTDDAGSTRVQLETGLSAREVEVLRLVCAGERDQQIAEALFISVKTVHSHLDRVRDKTGCRRRAELIRYAMDHGIA